MSRSVALCVLILSVPSVASAGESPVVPVVIECFGPRAPGPRWYVVGGLGASPVVSPAADSPAGGALAPASSRQPDGPDRRLATRGLAVLAVGMAGSEGPLRGGAEVVSLLGALGETPSGYTALVTYAGGDFGGGFAQLGLGLGGLWGGDRAGLDRVAGIVRGELGARLSDGVALVVRGDLLLGSELVSPIASVGLQWIPGERAPRPPRKPQRNPLEGAPAI